MARRAATCNCNTPNLRRDLQHQSKTLTLFNRSIKSLQKNHKIDEVCTALNKFAYPAVPLVLLFIPRNHQFAVRDGQNAAIAVLRQLMR